MDTDGRFGERPVGHAVTFDNKIKRVVIQREEPGSQPSNLRHLELGRDGMDAGTGLANRPTDHALAYDTVRDRVVLFGGDGFRHLLNDVGMGWLAMEPGRRWGPPTLWARMVFDGPSIALRRRGIIYSAIHGVGMGNTGDKSGYWSRARGWRR
jgi:hypothetical protein